MTEGKVGVSTPIVCYRAERVMEVQEDWRFSGARRRRNDNLPAPLCPLGKSFSGFADLMSCRAIDW